MLNPMLYHALKQAFKQVEIANEGQHAQIALTDNLMGWAVLKNGKAGEQYRVNCPFCGDIKKHLYISHLSYFRPMYKGELLPRSPLQCKCFRRECLKDRDSRAALEGIIARALSSMPIEASSLAIPVNEDDDPLDKYQVSSKITLEGIRTWAPDYTPIDENTREDVISYLISRNVTQEDVDWLKIGYGPIKSPKSGNYINNGSPFIMFPIIKNDALVGLQARAVPESSPPDALKYWFHPGCRKSTVIYNLDIARQLGLAVLTEGIFDVLSVGRPGVCSFGHTPSETQMRLLGTVGQGLIWLPDTDIRKDLNTIEMARESCARLNAAAVYPMGAHVVVLPKKDAGEMQRQEVWDQILEQVPEHMQQFLLERILPKL